jgi:hypothetical protein
MILSQYHEHPILTACLSNSAIHSSIILQVFLTIFLEVSYYLHPSCISSPSLPLRLHYSNSFSLYCSYSYVGFDVLTAVVMKSTIFRDITPCSPLSVNRRFGGTYRLHLQGRPWLHGVISQKMVLFITAVSYRNIYEPTSFFSQKFRICVHKYSFCPTTIFCTTTT